MVQIVVAFREGFLKSLEVKKEDTEEVKNAKEEERKKLEDMIERLRQLGLVFTSRHKWFDEIEHVKVGVLDQQDHILVGTVNAPNEDFATLSSNVIERVEPFLQYAETVYVRFKND